MLAPCYAQHKHPQPPGLLWLALASPGLIPDPTGSCKLTPQLERDQGRHSGCHRSRSRLGQTPRTLACELSTRPPPSPAPTFILAPNPGRCVYKFLYRTVMAEEEKKFSLTNLTKFIQLGEWAQNSSHLSVELMHLTFSSVKHLPIKPGVTHTHPVPGTKYIPQNICLMNG